MNAESVRSCLENLLINHALPRPLLKNLPTELLKGVAWNAESQDILREHFLTKVLQFLLALPLPKQSPTKGGEPLTPWEPWFRMPAFFLPRHTLNLQIFTIHWNHPTLMLKPRALKCLSPTWNLTLMRKVALHLISALYKHDRSELFKISVNVSGTKVTAMSDFGTEGNFSRKELQKCFVAYLKPQIIRCYPLSYQRNHSTPQICARRLV
jgi:hypothetical protein